MTPSPFLAGIRSMLPILTGVVPFGLVMGSVTASAGLQLHHSFFMNFLIFAGASQLATVDLLVKQSSLVVTVLTGWIINARMLLYSAAMSSFGKGKSLPMKALISYCITDQSYAVLMANKDRFESEQDQLKFYFGAALAMISGWQCSVAMGFAFGNVAPESWSLDFAVPLSFAALTIPALKSRPHIVVATLSSLAMILFSGLPYNLGLIVASLTGILAGAFLTKGQTE